MHTTLTTGRTAAKAPPLRHGPGKRRTGRILVWSLFALLLATAPLVLRSTLAVSMLSQIGYLVIVCLSYNILLGQGGMLSFGHAVYVGLGSFVAVHAINLAGAGQLPLPLWLIPLVGGLGGLFFAALFGYVSTKKSGTTFAMITLGLGELVAAMALMLPSFFGGEGGVTADRAYGQLLPGIDFGAQTQVYYLIAVYCFCCTALMYAFTGTPLGRMLNAVRDNPERVAFIGYDPQRVRYYAFMVAGFFAGIGGGLAAINFEIVNASDSLNVLRSGTYLLFTFLGGAGFFFGPIIGAALMVFALVLLSELSKAWLLYVGLVFLLMVMFAPGGVASLIMANLRVAQFGKLHRLCLPYLGLAAAAATLLAGLAATVEMVYHRQFDAALGPMLRLAGWQLDSASATTWLLAWLLLVAGAAWLELARRRFARAWDQVQQAIETEVWRREAA
ncbi:MAG TPA: branched-chain amino acid ABC transporter permease [Pseudorhodoferax sp.]|nr:branched-chain amino acid ABC transporter permease [Pseudorhodoferax sp.]